MAREARKRWGWILIAAGTYAGGIAAALMWVNKAKNAEGDVDIDILVWQVVVGTLLIGIGQLLSLAVHDYDSRGGVVVDGTGKAIALAGWSLGLVATVSFTGVGSDVSETAAGLVLGTATVIVPALLIAGGAVALIMARPAEADYTDSGVIAEC